MTKHSDPHVERERQRVRTVRYRERLKLGLVTRRERRPAAPKPTLPAASVLADLFTTPTLPGALCIGKHALFDPADHDDDHHVVEQLHGEAIELCRRCPALGDCRSWLETLPPQKQPTGVVAGRLNPEETKMTNPPTPNPYAMPDELAPGRAEFLRLCAALAVGAHDGITNVMAELSCLHPAAWQLTLQAAAREHLAALGVLTGLEPADLAGLVERQAMAALDDSEAVADRRDG